jgi:hypothetical protein
MTKWGPWRVLQEAQKFLPLWEAIKSPLPLFKKGGGNYKELQLKSPFEKAIQGDLRTSLRKEFMANAIYGELPDRCSSRKNYFQAAPNLAQTYE